MTFTDEQAAEKCDQLMTKEHIALHKETYKLQGKGAWMLFLQGDGSSLPFLDHRHLLYVPLVALPCFSPDKMSYEMVESMDEHQLVFIILRLYAFCGLHPQKQTPIYGTNYQISTHKIPITN